MSVAQAAATVKAELAQSGSEDDVAYFALHEARLKATASRIVELVPAKAEILDLGGHYLHLSSILALVGYHVTAVDVPVHSTLAFVRARAERMGIALRVVDGDDIARGTFLPGEADRFAGVLFCEILEHITFNPIHFWRGVHRVMRSDGLILVTTPNSLKLLSVLGAFWNLISLRRLGLNVRQIVGQATYGHHWKEYSAREIVEYFAYLSPDFRVRVRKVSYGPPSDVLRRQIGGFRTAILRLGNASGFFAENLEAVVTLNGKSDWRLEEPAPG